MITIEEIKEVEKRTTDKLDALGLPIVLGKTYGFCNDNNGIAHVCVGEAVNVTKKGLITISVIRFTRQYSINGKRDLIFTGQELYKASVKSIKLFEIC